MKPSTHTGREMELMLKGRKPLTVFHAIDGELPDEALVPEVTFAPHVRAGRIVRMDAEVCIQDSADSRQTVRYVLYALPGEQWRAQVMLVLKRAQWMGGGWNETCERVEGSLLGYTDEENDAHCAIRFPRHVHPG